MDQEIFGLRRGYNIGKNLLFSILNGLHMNQLQLHTTPSGSDVPPPAAPTLPEPRVNFLKMLSVPIKVTTLHIVRVINSHSLSILAHCSPFAFPLGLGNLVPFMSTGAELNKRFPKIADVLGKPTSLTQGLRTPRKEKLIGFFSLLGIPEE